MVSFFIGVYSAVISVAYFLLPLYLKGTLRFTGAQIGVLYAVLSLNAILVSFPVGVTGDRLPARILTRLGLAGIAASLWGMAGVGSFWPFLAVFWGFGLSLQLFRQSLDILLFKETGGDQARRFGEFNAVRMGGMVAGALAGGWLFNELNFPVTLKLFGAGVLLMLLATGRLPLTIGVRTPILQYGRDFFNRPVLFFAAWLFLFTLHWGAEATSLALFLENNLGLQPLGVGAYMAGEFAVISVTAYLYGRFWAGRLKPLTFLAVALVLLRQRPHPDDRTQPSLVLRHAGPARFRRRLDPHGDLHHRVPALPRGAHRGERLPHFAGHHPGGLRRLPDLRTPGGDLRLRLAPHRLRGHQPGPAPHGLRGFEGVRGGISEERAGGIFCKGFPRPPHKGGQFVKEVR